MIIYSVWESWKGDGDFGDYRTHSDIKKLFSTPEKAQVWIDQTVESLKRQRRVDELSLEHRANFMESHPDRIYWGNHPSFDTKPLYDHKIVASFGNNKEAKNIYDRQHNAAIQTWKNDWNEKHVEFVKALEAHEKTFSVDAATVDISEIKLWSWYEIKEMEVE